MSVVGDKVGSFPVLLEFPFFEGPLKDELTFLCIFRAAWRWYSAIRIAARSLFSSSSSRACRSSARLLEHSGLSPDLIGIRASMPKVRAYGVSSIGCLELFGRPKGILVTRLPIFLLSWLSVDSQPVGYSKSKKIIT